MCSEIKYKNYNIPIIYEDNHVICAVKPHGILSQSDISGDDDMLTALKEDIKVRYNKPGNVFLGLIHRLDRNTGGTMIFAKTSKGASRLSEQLRDKKMFKGYFAIVHGIPKKKKDYLYNKLEKNERTNTVSEHQGGKQCVLYYEVVAEYGNMSLVFAVPITGRTHQIRVQMSLAGYPLLGDSKYGKSICESKINKIKLSQYELALWSSTICIKHPTEDKIIKVMSVPSSGVWEIFDKSVYEKFALSVIYDRYDEFNESIRMIK